MERRATVASLFICTKGCSLVRVHAHRLAALRGNDRRRYRPLLLLLLSPNIDNAAKSLSVNTEHDIVVNADLDLLWLLQMHKNGSGVRLPAGHSILFHLISCGIQPQIKLTQCNVDGLNAMRLQGNQNQAKSLRLGFRKKLE